MMDVIVPPVILVLILALLITILSRAIKNAPSVKEDLENMRKASKKSKKLEEFSSLMKNKLSEALHWTNELLSGKFSDLREDLKSYVRFLNLIRL